jgi:Winged helix DNA-binding domain
VPERTLSTRALNRALLARQLLLERSDLPIARALESLAGLQAQYAPSPYIGLWSRLQGLRREALTTALVERDAVQGTLMRSTIHVVSARDYQLMADGIRGGRQDWWLRVQGNRFRAEDMEAVARRVRMHLADGPRRRSELVALLQAEGFPPVVWSGAGLWLDMVRVPPSGTWERRRADLYGLADGWVQPSAPTRAEALAHLLRRYLGAFGPASLGDAAQWAGLTVTEIRQAVPGLALRRFRDEQGGELLDLPRAPLPDPGTPAPVRFLPTWDASLLVHARRTLILPEAYRPLVFSTKTPQSVPTFLVDGAVAGTWRYQDGRVRWTAFQSLPRAATLELEEEAKRLAAFHADQTG